MDSHGGAQPSFTSKPEIVQFDGLLFDMDGTIVDSTDAIVKHWHKIGKQLGVDPSMILETSHGRRSIDTFAVLDSSKANWEYVSHVEGLIPKEFGADAVEVQGARALLADLEKVKAPWAIVTSGTRPLVTGWLDLMKLAHPRNMVVAEDVKQGKPDPECYLLGMERTGARIEGTFLVIEDSPAGIQAGKAAGCAVLGLATTHSIERVRDAGADWIVQDLRSAKLLGFNGEIGQVTIQISNALVSG